MALGEERFVGLAADFEGKLRMKNAILFIGRNMKEDVVRQIIGLYPWKIIATSRNTLPLEELQGIHIKIYSDEGDITAANLWKNDEFPVVYVWKKDESLNEEECQTLEITGESEEEYRVRRAQGMMKRLCKMIDNHNAMVVVGYAPETDNDMPYRAFATAVYNDCAIADNIQFWSEKSEETKLKKLADLKGIEFHTESLDEVLKARYAWCAADPKFEGRSKTTLKRDAASMIEEYYTKGEKIKRLEGLLECIGRAPKLEDKIAELREEKALAERKAKEYSNSASPWCFQDLLFKELEQKLRKTLDEKKCSMLPEDLLQYQVEAIAKGENSSS